MLSLYSIYARFAPNAEPRIVYMMDLINFYIGKPDAAKCRTARAAHCDVQDYAEEERNKAINLANARVLKIGSTSYLTALN